MIKGTEVNLFLFLLKVVWVNILRLFNLLAFELFLAQTITNLLWKSAHGTR